MYAQSVERVIWQLNCIDYLILDNKLCKIAIKTELNKIYYEKSPRLIYFPSSFTIYVMKIERFLLHLSKKGEQKSE